MRLLEFLALAKERTENESQVAHATQRSDHQHCRRHVLLESHDTHTTKSIPWYTAWRRQLIPSNYNRWWAATKYVYMYTWLHRVNAAVDGRLTGWTKLVLLKIVVCVSTSTLVKSIQPPWVMSGRFIRFRCIYSKNMYLRASCLSLPCTQQTGATTVAAAPVASTTASSPPSPSIFKTFPTTHLPTGQSPVCRTLAEQGKQRQTCPQGTTI